MVALLPMFGLVVVTIVIAGPVGLLLGGAVAAVTYWPTGYLIRKQLNSRRRCLDMGICPRCGSTELVFSEQTGFRCTACTAAYTSSGEQASN